MKVKAWLVVKGKRSQYRNHTSGPWKGSPVVDSARIYKVQQGKPDTAQDEVAFQIELDIPEAWFQTPTAVINVALPEPPTDPASAPAVTVDMPVKPKAPSQAASVVRRP